MKILVIGASRGVGRQLTQQALVANHAVTVLVRAPDRLGIRHPRLTIVQGDILDAERVQRAVLGQDAVCICIGHAPSRKPVNVFSEGTRVVLHAMHEAGVKRLLCITGIGAGETRGHGGFFYDRIFQPLLLKSIYDDKDRQEAVIKASDVDWTIVRPGFLTNGALTAAYRVVTEMADIRAGRISRADVAHFMLRELQAADYLQQAPLLTY